MARYHIRKDGLPGECRAKAGACPLGGEHYDSKADAIEAAAEKAREEGNFLVSVKKRKVYHVSEAGAVEECPFREGYCTVRPFNRYNNLHSSHEGVIDGAARAFREQVGASEPERPVGSTAEPIPPNPQAQDSTTAKARKIVDDGYDHFRRAGWTESEIKYYRDSCGHSYPPGRSHVPWDYNGDPIPEGLPGNTVAVEAERARRAKERKAAEEERIRREAEERTRRARQTYGGDGCGWSGGGYRRTTC